MYNDEEVAVAATTTLQLRVTELEKKYTILNEKSVHFENVQALHTNQIDNLETDFIIQKDKSNALFDEIKTIKKSISSFSTCSYIRDSLIILFFFIIIIYIILHLN
ncbi:MAG: hypothetical protein AABY22_35365 [Nanoarchaeota archaeon]